MASTLPLFPSFDPRATRWKKYVARFKDLIVALDITDTARQKALLLHFVAGTDFHILIWGGGVENI